MHVGSVESDVEKKDRAQAAKQRNGIDGTAVKEPVLIEVKGLFVDTDSPRYVAEKMGSFASHDEREMNEGQHDPLTRDSSEQNKGGSGDYIKKGRNIPAKTGNAEMVDAEDGTGMSKAPRTNSVEDRKPGTETSGARNNNTSADEDNDDVDDNNETTNAINNNEGGENNNTKVKQTEDSADGKKTEDDIVVLVAGKDDVDAASTYSLFMDKDFRYYFQHPYSRLTIAYLVVFCNFLIYAEDPVAHSRKECLIPMIGNDFAFVCTRYPPNAWSLLKVVFWLAGLIIGLFVGKLLVHGLLFNRLFRLKMFTEDQGSWMIMFLISLITIFIMSLFYNLFLMIGGESTAPYRISDLMGVSNDYFMKAAACGTWCGDFFTAWMVTDIMLQEKLYPGWARPVRKWWKAGYHRIILFWIVVVVTSFVVIFVIATDYINWDKLNHDFLPTNELSRAFLASFILVMDFLIVMQDWDFPHFISAIDIKLPGLNTAHIRFQIPKCLKREHWNVHITGKWFNYGILFIVMLLDLNMWKNQIFYGPYDYGQYTGPEGRIYTVQDDYSLENFNESQVTFDYRSTTINPDTNKTYVDGDTHMNTKYLNYALGVKCIAFIPSVIALIVFGVLIWNFGRFKPTESDPYAGRLKKRMKRKISFKESLKKLRLPWKRKEEITRKIHAVPKLLYFKRRGTKGKEEDPKEVPSDGFVENTYESNIKEEMSDTKQLTIDKKDLNTDTSN